MKVSFARNFIKIESFRAGPKRAAALRYFNQERGVLWVRVQKSADGAEVCILLIESLTDLTKSFSSIADFDVIGLKRSMTDE